MAVILSPQAQTLFSKMVAHACMAYKKRHINVCSQLLKRAQNGGSVQGDLKILRTLLEKKTSKYEQVWRQASHHPVGFDCGHLFFDQFKTCYSTWGTRKAPTRLVYKLPARRTAEKIESALVFESPIDQGSFVKCSTSDQRNYGHKACVIGVTADGWIVRHCLNSGELLQRVFLSSWIRFKHLLWETDLQRIVVKSIHIKNGSESLMNMQRASNSGHCPILYLALFEVAPLTFVALIPIEKAIFGQGIVDASLSMGVLGVMHQSGKICFYSMDKILEENTHVVHLRKPHSPQTHSNGHGNIVDRVSAEQCLVGEYPLGLPINVAFASQPPVLFECSSYQHMISFGGHPWHYIVCSHARHDVFQVYSVKDNVLVKNGVLETETLSLEPDQAYFHGDNSGHLLHIGPHSVRCLKLCQKLNSRAESAGYELKPCFLLNFEQPPKSPSSNQQLRFTSSGRLIKRRLNQGNPEQEIVKDIDYEDELDILVVLSSSECKTGICGRVGLYDNQTGSFIRAITISEWDEDGDHSIMMERDVILHITKGVTSRKFTCTLYRLTP